MKFCTIVNADLPDGKIGSWHVGYHDTMRATESGIRTAIAEARAARGTAIAVRLVEVATGRCRYITRVAA